MAIESYINGYSVTVGSGGIDGSSTSLPVSAAAPVAGGFRILIDSELMLVASGGTTTAWTVSRGVEGTTAAAHSAGATIAPVVTAVGWNNIRAQQSGADVFANRPSSGQVAGDRFSATDRQNDYVWNGSAYSAVPRGAMVLLEQHAASSSAELDFTTWYSSAYDQYILEFVNLIPSSNNVDVEIQCSSDGGTTYDTGSNYVNRIFYVYSGGTGNTNAGTAYIRATGSASSNSNYGLSGFLYLENPGGTGVYKLFHGQTVNYDATASDLLMNLVCGRWTSLSAMNAFRVLAASGNLASGTVRVYGIAKA